jgi:exonuclease 1
MELALDRPCTKFVNRGASWGLCLPSLRYVEFAMHRVRMLIHFGVTPYLVFDGDNLPSKASTEAERAKKRDESKRRGLELYKASKVSQAYPEFQKAVDVTPYMARQLIEELKKMNIQYVVAPYEADAQLAYLERKGIINGILSEDSDLLVYGAKRLITKLDQHGDCIEISRTDFASCRDITLAGFTDADFRRMAILSGCDYLASINKVGLKTAHTYVRKYKNIEKILRMLQFEQKFVVPSSYLERFYEAERTFLHHRVFCPLEKKLVLSTELEDGMKEEDMPFLGKNVNPETAIGVACGDLDPMTKKQIIPNIVSSSSRSMPDLHRRHKLASAHDLKPSKSIDNFFKPKRQPLAELDPNSLTPSPSQQRLLNLHRNASWEARPVSSAPQPRQSISFLQGSDQRRSSDRSAFLERAAAPSTFQPTKRTRLCSDVDTSPPGKDGRSSFFTAKPEPSPSIRKKGRTKKARRSDIEIFSDDSIADIFQDMQESDGSPNDSSAMPSGPPGNSEGNVTAGFSESQMLVTEICDTPRRQRIQIPQSTISQRTSVTSVSATENPEDFQDLLDIHVKKLDYLRNTFAYQSPEKQAAALSWLSPSNEANRRSEPEIWEAQEQSSREGRESPNQAAPSPRHTLRTPSLHMTFGNQSSSQQAAALRSLSQFQSPGEKVKLGLAALNSAPRLESQRRPMTPLERLGQRALKSSSISLHGDQGMSVTSDPEAGKVEAGDDAQTGSVLEVNIQGSEDLLVPNSEDDASESSEVDNPKPLTRTLDLTRFAFTANG